MISVGIFVSYLVGYAFADAGGWRWMLGLGAVPAVVMFFGLLRLSESPCWLFTQGRPEDARVALLRIHTPAQAEQELREISTQISEESRFSYRDVLKPTLRPAVLLGVAVAATNQLVGVNAVIYYTPTMLRACAIHGY